MIKNTELLYRKAKEFQDKRSDLNKKYEKDLQSIERFKGSQGYEADMKKLKDQYEADMKKLIEENRHDLFDVLGYMMTAIQKRSISAPSAEQLNLLNLLKMKENVTLEECERIAEAVKDNPIALSIVTETAHKHGIMRSFNHLCPEMTNESAYESVKSLKNWLQDFIQYDTTKASRTAKRYHDEHYGMSEIQLTKRRLFSDQKEFYQEIFPDDWTLEQFTKIVDAED